MKMSLLKTVKQVSIEKHKEKLKVLLLMSQLTKFQLIYLTKEPEINLSK